MTLHTEDEAKTRWCPMTARNGSAAAGAQASGTIHCIASNCMAWRKHDQVGIGPDGEKRERDMDGRTRWVDRGYCGLAGRVTP